MTLRITATTALIAAAAGASLVLARPLPALAVFVFVVVAVTVRVSPRLVVSGLLVYLCAEELLLTYVPGSLVAYVRYAPEALIDSVALLLFLNNIDLALRLFRRGIFVVVGVLAAWFASAFVAAVPLTTALIGMRSELRFMPLVVIAGLTRFPRSDAYRVARTLIFLAAAESVLALVEAVGGARVRALFAPNWHVAIGGVTFAQGKTLDRGIAFGTFSSHNSLGLLLVFGWLALIAIGRADLRISRRAEFAIGSLILTATLVSGSRQAALGTLIVTLVVARMRFGFPAVRLAAASIVGGVALLPFFAGAINAAPSGAVSYGSVVKRWQAIASPATWQANQYSNFRLYMLKSDVATVLADSPALGFGLGSVSDQRWLANRKNAIYRTAAGERAAAFSYLYDGNWSLLVLEVGLVGLAAAALLLVAIGRLGLAIGREAVGRCLVAIAILVPFLGFFAPILQLRLPGAIIWSLTGFGFACANRDGSSPLVGDQERVEEPRGLKLRGAVA